MKSKIISLLVLTPCILFSQGATDTLWSVPQLDGGIDFRPVSGIFSMSTNSQLFSPGDGYDVLLEMEVFTREYLAFDLNMLSNQDTSAIVQAIIGVYQLHEVGNNQPNIYPIWNLAGGDTHFCVLDHINYGFSLDLGDWTAGDPGDPQTLHTNVGIISSDTINGYKTMDVTCYLKEDLANARRYNQYRMRFTIDTDNDSLGDLIDFVSGNALFSPRPYLTIYYGDTTTIKPLSVIPSDFHLYQNYPNPFNSSTHIQYLLSVSAQVELTIFNLAGQQQLILVKQRQLPGNYQITFNADNWPTGVLFYRLKVDDYSTTKTMLLIR